MSRSSTPTTLEPPRAPPPRFGPQTTRWEKEKAAAGDSFDFVDDPTVIGLWLMGETVGKGASGRVRIARHTRTGKIAAAKIIPAKDFNASRLSLAAAATKADKQRMGIEREILMMKLMDHPNIMRLYDVWENNQDLYLILEYVEGGELFDYLVNRGKLHVPEALNYFRQIISGLHYCHSYSIIHRDLKPENILLCGPKLQNIKIADWGMATLQLPSNQLETSCGSPHYASPEIVNGQKYEGAPSDIWSSGVILFALLSGRLPFDDKNIRALLDKVRLGKFQMPSGMEPRARDLISRMLVVDSSQRITMAEILQHPFMKMDTPGIGPTLAPPPYLDQDALIRAIAPENICQASFDSLMAIWIDKIDGDDLFNALTSPGRNFYKSIYQLLLKYKERSMEEYNMNEDYDGSTRPKAVTPRHRAPPRPPTASPNKRASTAAPAPRQRSGSRPRSSHRPASAIGSPTIVSPNPPVLPRIRVSTRERDPSRDRTGPISPVVTSPVAEPPAPAQASATALGFIVPPIVADPALQQTIDNLAEQVNALVPIHNAQTTNDTFVAPKRRETGEEKENVRVKGSMGPPQVPGKRKDDEMPGTYHTVRRSTVSAANPAKATVNKANAQGISSNGGRDIIPSKGGDNKRKSKPAPLDLSIPKYSRQGSDGYGPTSSQLSSVPTPVSSPFLGTPVVSEFRGWFTNLFNWKAQTLSLNSSENCLASRDEAAKILMRFGVICGLEDIEGWGILRCKMEEVLDGAGNTQMKSARFRIEFTPALTSQYVSVATLVLEKGALSTFKAAFQHLRAHWTLDVIPPRTSGDNWVAVEPEAAYA